MPLQNSAHTKHWTIYEQYNFHFLLPFIDIWFCDYPGVSTLWAAQYMLQLPTGARDSSLLHTIDSESRIYPAPRSSVDTSVNSCIHGMHRNEFTCTPSFAHCTTLIYTSRYFFQYHSVAMVIETGNTQTWNQDLYRQNTIYYCLSHSV